MKPVEKCAGFKFFGTVTMLITKYTAILLESARTAEARSLARTSDGGSSLDSIPDGRRPVRRRHFTYRYENLNSHVVSFK